MRTWVDRLARDLGLDMGKFKSALESHKYASLIQADMAAGSAVGANGTPTLFINGRKLAGAYPFDSFAKIIDEELAKKGVK